MAKENKPDTPAVATRSTSPLPAEVAKLYELVNWTGGHRQHFGKHGIIDLKTMTVAKAASLVAAKFKKLRKK